MEELAKLWLDAKEREREATEQRRAIEDRMSKMLEIEETFDKTSKVQVGQYEIKVSGRIDRKVDADLVQEISYENNLNEWMGVLFRWKAELNQRAWDSSPENITNLMSAAIVTKAGRPSYSITIKE